MQFRWVKILGAVLFTNVSLFATTGTLYVTNNNDNSVSVIDVATRQVVDTILITSVGPFGVAATPNNTEVLVANTLGPTVSVIETAANIITREDCVGSAPVMIAVTPNGDKAYVSDQNDGVIVYDVATGSTITSISVGLNTTYGVAVAPDGALAYAVIFASPSTVVAIDTTTDAIAYTVDPVGDGCTNIAITPNGEKAYVANNNINEVSILDLTQTPAIVSGSIVVGTSPTGVAVLPNGLELYVANFLDDTVSVVNVATDLVTTTINLPTGSNPYYVTVSADGKEAYIVNSTSNSVSVIDVLSQSVVANIPVGNSPVAAAFIGGSPQPPSNFQGSRINNRFLFSTDRVNHLTWTPSRDETVTGYILLRNGSQIATIPASGPYLYNDSNRKEGQTDVYSLTAVNANAVQSVPVTVTLP